MTYPHDPNTPGNQSHPEGVSPYYGAHDASGAPANSPYPSGGYPPNGGYAADPYPGQPQNFGAETVNGNIVVTGDGTPNVVGSIIIGFRLLFAKPAGFLLFYLCCAVALILWMSATIAVLILSMMKLDESGGITLEGLATPFAIMGVIILIGLIFTLFVQAWSVNGCLQASEGRHVRFKDMFNMKHGLAMGVIAFAIVSFISLIPSLIALPSIIDAVKQAMTAVEADPASYDPNAMNDFNSLGANIIDMLSTLILTLITPFFMFFPYIIIDHGVSLGQAAKQSLSLGKANWIRLFLFTIVSGIVSSMAIFLTLGIGALFVLPALGIATALIYRQISGGRVVATD